jgi:hypothetical protein
MKQALGECSSLAALKGNEEFHSANPKAISREVRSNSKSPEGEGRLGLKSILSKYSAISAGLFCEARRQVNGSVMPSTVNDILSAQEYRDAFLSAMGDVLEISNLIVMVVARRPMT